MSRSILLLFALLLSLDTTQASSTFPAVDLPPVVPDFIRDRAARELAATRDRLGRAIHPFRGEFHGLGNPSGGWSRANGLSANGRVVVGSIESGFSSQTFVWSPWTGQATYNTTPAGLGGRTRATAVSGNGVYVAGNVTLTSPDFIDAGFVWSLAGRSRVVSPDYANVRDLSLSHDGGVVVGTLSDAPIFNGNLTDNDGIGSIVPVSRTRAFHARRNGVPEELPSPDGYGRSEAIDVSADGHVVLGNTSPVTPLFDSISILEQLSQPILERQPVIWRDGKAIPLGGLPRPGFPMVFTGTGILTDAIVPFTSRATEANAISADGSTVVGMEGMTTTYPFPFSSLNKRTRTAILWREETGWIDLGTLPPTSDNPVQKWYEATDVSGDGSVVVGNAGIRAPGVGSDCATFYCGFTEEATFLWDEQRGMRHLAEVLQLDYGLDLGGWDLGEATAISDDGTTIIGNGTNPNGDNEAWRAVLQRETPDGDLDFDGDVDQYDYQTLVDNLGMTSERRSVFYADGDVNADGLVDQQDADTLLALYEHRRLGDFNADGRVDTADYTVWRSHWGSASGIADANGDGLTNDADLAVWRSRFGSFVERVIATVVPEPTSLAVSVLLAIGLTASHRGCCVRTPSTTR